MTDASGMRWVVTEGDPEAIKAGIAELATRIGVYYHFVLLATNNKALAEELTRDYQRALFNLASQTKEKP